MPHRFQTGESGGESAPHRCQQPSQEVGRRKHGGLYLKVLALNSQEGLEGASQEEIQAKNRPGSPHPGVTITVADG